MLIVGRACDLHYLSWRLEHDAGGAGGFEFRVNEDHEPGVVTVIPPASFVFQMGQRYSLFLYGDESALVMDRTPPQPELLA